MGNDDAATIANNDHTNRPRKKFKIRLIVMGGGYDTRSMKLLERYLLLGNDDKTGNDVTPQRHYDLLHRKLHPRQSLQHRFRKRIKRGRSEEGKQDRSFDNNIPSLLSLSSLSSSSREYNLECYELDLPEVVRAKRQLIQTRLHRRRPWLKHMNTATKLIPVDFNDVDETRKALEGILLSPSSPNGNITDDNHRLGSGDDVLGATTNIILFEGVMIYLDGGVPHALLKLCSDVLGECSNLSTVDRTSTRSSSSGYLCFADRLENIPSGEVDAAKIELESTGWELLDWLPKPGLARHMGVARLRM